MASNPGGNRFEGNNTLGSGEQLRDEAERLGGYLSKYVDLSVGRVDVKVDGLEKQLLEALKGKPDHRDLLSLRNWMVGTIIATGLGIVALIYTFMMNGSDRSDSAISQGMEIGRALGQQQTEIEQMKGPKNVEAPKPAGSSGKR